MKKLKKILLLAAALMSPWAQGQSLNVFLNHLKDYNAAPESYLKTKVNSKDLKVELLQKAIEISQIWGDTILEGDYEVAGSLRLDRALKISKRGAPLFYHLTFSDRAWNLAECKRIGFVMPSRLGCLKGRIQESAFVSLDLSSFEFDELDRARFRPIKSRN